MAKRPRDDLRPEYDLSRLKGGVRGKYYRQAAVGTNLVLLEPDVARAFPDSTSVNRALRLLQDVATKASGRARKPARPRRTPPEGRGVRRETKLGPRKPRIETIQAGVGKTQRISPASKAQARLESGNPQKASG